jgi:2,3-bisphosphoglycerate-independent phosphoglycerate mutase
MDRDNRFERIQKAYDSSVFGKNKQNDIFKYVDDSYLKKINDEFIEPASFNSFDGINDCDGIIFCNFRNDRSREFLYTLAKNDFDEFKTKKFKQKPNILLITQYDDNLPQKVMFKKVQPKDTLASTISKQGLRQAHIAESEKYAHVTFFLNGGVQELYKNESHILVPSLKVDSYASVPYMRAKEITNKTIEAMSDNDFIVINYANGDMVGHCGNYESAIEAVQAVDFEIGRILKACKENNFSLILTSDHGNCETMMDDNGVPLTNHTIGDVFCFVVDKRVKKITNGTLCNLANSVFSLMKIPCNKDMLPPLFELE